MPDNAYWCFTIWDSDWDIPKENLENNIRYIIWQHEIAPSTGNEHIQGYLELKTKKSMKVVKSYLGTKEVHLETRKGTREQARSYCCDQAKIGVVANSVTELGHWVTQAGERTDLNIVKKKLDEGLSMSEIADEHFESWCKYNRAFDKYRTLKQIRRNWMTELHIYWGAPGTGKSRKAFDDFPNAYVLRRSNSNCVWWDGYDGHDTVIIDDFYGWIPFDLLLRLADRYPLLVDTKGGAVEFTAKRVIITSNSCPEEWYPNISCRAERWGALKRRITQCIVYKGAGSEVGGNTDPNLYPLESDEDY